MERLRPDENDAEGCCREMALTDGFSGLQVYGPREDISRDGGQEEDVAGCGDGGVVGRKVRTAAAQPRSGWGAQGCTAAQRVISHQGV